MALAVKPVFCQINSAQKAAVQPHQQAESLQISVPVQNLDARKIVLQPRLCTLRSYGSDRAGMIKSNKSNGGDGFEDVEVSRFFGTLSEYIESTKKSQDFEIISGRLAMVNFF